MIVKLVKVKRLKMVVLKKVKIRMIKGEMFGDRLQVCVVNI